MTELDHHEESLELVSPNVPLTNISRRSFIAVGLGTAATLVLPKTAQAKSDSSNLISSYKTTSPALNPPSDQSFFQPYLKSSQDGKVSGNWVMNQGEVTLGLYTGTIRFYADESAPDTHLIPSPTLCVNPGDLIEISLKNSAPPNDDACATHQPNQPNCFNSTNLHFHGLHVSPLSIGKDGKPRSGGHPADIAFSSDDVLVEMTPGEKNNYKVQLPANHAPGTHWYHPHRHGSTAVQVANGMAGLIVIKEPANQAICPDAPDVIWVLQDVVSDGGTGIIADAELYAPFGGNPGECLVNGQYQPTLTVQKGEIQRWRILNAGASPRTLMNLRLCKGTVPQSDLDALNAKFAPGQDTTGVPRNLPAEPESMYLIARDGINLYGKKPNVQTNHAFSPGNRADFLVNLAPGNYTLIKDAYTGSKDVYGNAKDDNEAVESRATVRTRQVLAYITVTETPYAKAATVKGQFEQLLANGIPTTGMSSYLNPFIGEVPQNSQPVNFEAVPRNPGQFTIDNRKYGEPGAKFTVALNSQEEWLLDSLSNVTHPFHIHVNPFQVVAIGSKNQQGVITWNDIPSEDRIWQDTVAVDPNIPLKIQHRFDDYNGTFVLHCHILFHEDQGMMYDVEVTGNGIPPGVINTVSA
ncbi:multicopper oxidase type 2 [Rippkaea orientalis PCC 8801]|uniref:Multicopper oxidase type 2 n=1 Tax=Rippkaea orientalis (strain PCC 8801 / RF-1) TaxID=41431 RepID=B7K2F6_RIPO1|nr:multicopper oxidase domain-containing protein [Rippkaea orientalis]ACK66349.1 multicopper oxidase type 2 [Rippkaea orientalis PCC 8801]